MGGRSPVVVIWRYSPDSHARQDGRKRNEEEGDEEVRWLYDGQGVSGLRGGRLRESELEREREHGRDYSAVYSNGQSDPHQSQRAPPNIPDTLV